MSRCWWKADEPLENLAGGKRVSRWKNLMGADEPLDNSDGENISGAKNPDETRNVEVIEVIPITGFT